MILLRTFEPYQVIRRRKWKKIELLYFHNTFCNFTSKRLKISNLELSTVIGIDHKNVNNFAENHCHAPRTVAFSRDILSSPSGKRSG